MKSNSLSAQETLDLIADFTSDVQSYSEREGRIDYAEKLRNSQDRQNVAEEEIRIEKEAEERIGRARKHASEQKANLDSVAKTRSKRIDVATMNVRNALISRVRQEEGHYKYGLQKRLMDAGREREASLAGAGQEKDAYLESVRHDDERFGKLEEAAIKAMKGFGGVRKKLVNRLEKAAPAAEPNPEKLSELYSRVGKQTASFRKQPLLGFFGAIPLVVQILVVALLGGAVVPIAGMMGIEGVSWIPVLSVTGGVIVLIVLLYAVAISQCEGYLKRAGKGLVEAKKLRKAVHQIAEDHYQYRVKEIDEAHKRVREDFERGLKSSGQFGADQRYASSDEVDERGKHLKQELQNFLSRRRSSIDEKLNAQIAAAESDRDSQLSVLRGESPVDPSKDFEAQRQNLVAEWQTNVLPRERMIAGESAVGMEPEWSTMEPAAWQAPGALKEHLTIGTIGFSLEGAEVSLKQDGRLQLEDDGQYRMPLRLGFPQNGSVLIETKNTGREEAIAVLNNLVLGLMLGSPPGRLSFSLFDPVGLGESFAGLMHLADYDEHLINTRIRTQSDQIERRLGDLCDHMEKVIQMYLRNEYDTISEYNEAAGTIAERYHFIVVADFPKQFSEEAGRRLMSIASAGARCGVFMLIHCDQRADLPAGFEMEDLRRSCLCIRHGSDGFVLKDAPVNGTSLSLFQPPPADKLIEWVHRIGEANRDSNRIEVPFRSIAPSEEEIWSIETSKELRVPIGRTGATKLQYLAIGKGTCQHALIAGKTGSGKSTLFHVMITNMALWCDPNEVEFYLIDFKKGVEFKCYADRHLPHARVIAIESDREFGLSVLQRLDQELKERGEKFRAAGVQDVAGYKKAGGKDPVPRTLLLIDEFQEFFTEDDQISQQAAVLLDRIVRQGRAFGIHAILGSQTLGGAFTLARATLGQMVIRIALQCNEADAYLIMDDTNPAPRLLTRPGEGIYNDSAGSVEANSPFQVVWFTDEERDQMLDYVEKRAAKQGLDDKPRVVFEGNAPAHVFDDRVVTAMLKAGPQEGTPHMMIGAPNAIKGPTEISFERQSGSNLLIVGQRDDAVEAMTAIGMHELKAQMGDRCRIVLIDGAVSDPNSQSWLKETLPLLANEVEVPDSHQIGDKINELAAEMKAKSEGGAPAGPVSTFIFILGLQRYKKLRYEDDFSFSLDDEEGDAKPSASLNDLICEGAGVGYHLIISLDTYNNVNRCISRKAISEFEKKILFQMSAADSASLIESGKASDLGMNRALYYNEPTGVVEVFRPFAQPRNEWFQIGR